MLLAAMAFFSNPSFAQGPINSGSNYSAAIGVAGEVDTWSLNATQGATVIVSVGEPAGATSSFSPRVRVFAPGGSEIANASASTSTWTSFSAPTTGAYSITVSAVELSGTGSYRLTSLVVPSQSVVDNGDQGGAIANGALQPARIDVADLDAWTFAAPAAGTVIVRPHA